MDVGCIGWEDLSSQINFFFPHEKKVKTLSQKISHFFHVATNHSSSDSWPEILSTSGLAAVQHFGGNGAQPKEEHLGLCSQQPRHGTSKRGHFHTKPLWFRHFKAVYLPSLVCLWIYLVDYILFILWKNSSSIWNSSRQCNNNSVLLINQYSRTIPQEQRAIQKKAII